MAAVIESVGLVKRYGSFPAVRGVTFSVNAGEVFGLLGPNGAGKTSFMRMLSCVSPVTEGRLSFQGLDVMTEPRTIKARLGMVTQDDTLDTDLPVIDNLLVYARYFGITGRRARERAMEVLRLFQLDDRAQSKVDALSGGIKHRLLIARALLNEPSVLVLDEPTTGLDPQARRLVWQKLLQLRDQGVTTLLSTHSMEEATELCDRIVVLHLGEILAEGTPKELVERHVGAEVAEFQPGFAHMEELALQLQAIGAAVEQAGDTLYAFGLDGRGLDELGPLGATGLVRAANLEDVFLRLTGRGLQE